MKAARPNLDHPHAFGQAARNWEPHKQAQALLALQEARAEGQQAADAIAGAAREMDVPLAECAAAAEVLCAVRGASARGRGKRKEPPDAQPQPHRGAETAESTHSRACRRPRHSQT